MEFLEGNVEQGEITRGKYREKMKIVRVNKRVRDRKYSKNSEVNK